MSTPTSTLIPAVDGAFDAGLPLVDELVARLAAMVEPESELEVSPQIGVDR